ncbi:MAG: G5 domain-containing protein [Clostridia bacterium]|nr:G5 domain-containing protein [Clostridia bacterium]
MKLFQKIGEAAKKAADGIKSVFSVKRAGNLFAALLFAASLVAAALVAVTASSRENSSAAEYEPDAAGRESGAYMQQYTYSLFQLGELFVAGDPATDNLAESSLIEKVVVDGGVRSTFYSEDMTVGEFFDKNFITLGVEDTVSVEEDVMLSDCGEIEINRVGYSLQTEIKYTNFRTTTYRVWFLAAINRVPGDTAGRKGQTKLTYKCKYVDGKLVEKELLSSVKLSNPKDAVRYVVYHPEWEAHGLDMSYVVDVVEYGSTAYSSQQKNLSFCTAMGYHTDYGIAAVSHKNPGAVRMGSWIYVVDAKTGFEYGYTYVCDTSGSSNPTWIDLHFDTVAEARAWGRRRVKIYILSGRPSFVDPPERYKKK